METINRQHNIDEQVVDAIIEPALNPPLSIEVKNITVSFPSSKGKGMYTAIKEIDLR